jgi:hypothetical protein
MSREEAAAPASRSQQRMQAALRGDEPPAFPGAPGRPATSLEGALLRNIDRLNDLIRDMLQSFPDTAGEQEWRDRAGALQVRDPDGQLYRAYTEDGL